MCNLLESPNEDGQEEAYDPSHDETPEEREERMLMDAMINGYHSRLYVPDYILYEAENLD